MKLKIGANPYITNEKYHADREYLSSSALKMLLYKPETFVEVYKENKPPIVSKNSKRNFDFGSLCHTLILEPKRLHKDFAFYPGKQRVGKIYLKFAQKHEGKIILTKYVLARAKKIVNRFKKTNRYKRAFSNGKPEITVCQIIDGVKCKARFDYINIKKGLIVDLKTTRWPRRAMKEEHIEKIGPDRFEWDARKFKYWLSAALYIQIAETTYKKPFQFLFVSLCKTDGSHHIHSSYFSRLDIKKGHKQVEQALDKYQKLYPRRNY